MYNLFFNNGNKTFKEKIRKAIAERDKDKLDGSKVQT